MIALKNILFTLATCSTIMAFAQNENNRFKVSQTSIQPFFGRNTDNQLSKNDILNLTNNEIGLSQDLIDNLGKNQNVYYFQPNTVGVNVNLGIQIRDKQTNTFKSNRLVRVGINAGSYALGKAHASLSETSRIDTLNSGSNVLFVDSIISEHANFSKSAEFINLDFSLIYQTNQEKQFSLYGGGGISFGVSLNSYTQLNYHKNYNYEFTGAYSNNNYNAGSYSFLNPDVRYEKIKNRMNTMAMFYMPIGGKMRLGNHNEFLKRMHLFYEFRPAILITNIPELGTSAIFTSQQGLGLSLKF